MNPMKKSLDLPEAIAAYFAADKREAGDVSRCFTDNAIVRDEAHSYRGRDAIGKWSAETSAKYQYTSEPLASEQREGKTIVTSRLTGSFPGSPVDLRFFFELESGKIASLEIIP